MANYARMIANWVFMVCMVGYFHGLDILAPRCHSDMLGSGSRGLRWAAAAQALTSLPEPEQGHRPSRLDAG